MFVTFADVLFTHNHLYSVSGKSLPKESNYWLKTSTLRHRVLDVLIVYVIGNIGILDPSTLL